MQCTFAFHCGGSVFNGGRRAWFCKACSIKMILLRSCNAILFVCVLGYFHWRGEGCSGIVRLGLLKCVLIPY